MPNVVEKKPIEQGLIARVTGALKVLTGANQAVDNAWFGPLSPPAPTVTGTQVESVTGRAFDFPAGYNTRLTPRSGENISFPQMRALADSCDILRLVIETRKDQIAKMKFSVCKKDDDDGEHDDRCKEVEAFLAMPDGENTWDDWLRMLLEEMLVIDAASIYPWLNNDGTPYRFEIVDGATIKRVLDERGRTPMAPLPAYQQVLKGTVAVNYSIDELLYAPRNKRIHKVYGYSPVEQVIMTVNIAIRRGLHKLQYYTDGSMPDLLFQVPPDWQMNQIKEFNDWWQNSLAGNTAARSKAQFVPNGVTPLNTKEAILKDEYDEWLARIICYAFSVSPQAFIKQLNRSTGETAHEMALEEGLLPIMIWIRSIINRLIWKYFGYTDLEFKWDDQDSTDPLTQNTMDDLNLKNGSATLNEVRAKRGDAPLDGGDIPMVLTSSGYVPITQRPVSLNDQSSTQTFLSTGETEESEVKEEASSDLEPGSGNDKKQGVYKRFEKAQSKGKVLSPIKKNTELTEKIASDLSAKIEKFLKARAKVLIKALTTKMAKADSDDPLDGIDWSGWDDLEALFLEGLELVAKSGVADASLQLGITNKKTLELANEEALSYAKSRAAELVGKRINSKGIVVDNPNPEFTIEDSTREMVRAEIVKALEEGFSTDELALILEDSYAFSETRAETIARTETATADSQGNMALYKSSGQVELKKWIVGDGCCDACQELNGEIVKLDEPFSDGSDCAPAHPNCRCDIAPILSEDE